MDIVSQFIYAVLVSYVALFPVLNPLGGSLMFHSVTYSLDTETKNKLARKIAFNALFLLIGVLFLGIWVLKLFGISIPIVQIAGGAVVATRGWIIMNTGARPNTTSSETIHDDKTAMGSAFFPLTLPMTAGPGSIATAITLGAEAQDAPEKLAKIFSYVGFSFGILFAAITVFLTYYYAGYLIRRLGDNGRVVIMKLSSFITLCIGLSIIWKGIEGLIAIYVGGA